MKVKYFERSFSELACGDVYLGNPDSNYPCMKIKPIVDKNGGIVTAIRIDDGESMYPKDTTIVYPLNCFLARN